MIEELEKLWALADECREWSQQTNFLTVQRRIATMQQFKRIADELDGIAKRLAGRMPT